MEWKRELHRSLKSFQKKKTQSEQVEDIFTKEIELKKVCEIMNSGKIEGEESYTKSLEESQKRFNRTIKSKIS